MVAASLRTARMYWQLALREVWLVFLAHILCLYWLQVGSGPSLCRQLPAAAGTGMTGTQQNSPQTSAGLRCIVCMASCCNSACAILGHGCTFMASTQSHNHYECLSHTSCHIKCVSVLATFTAGSPAGRGLQLHAAGQQVGPRDRGRGRALNCTHMWVTCGSRRISSNCSRAKLAK